MSNKNASQDRESLRTATTRTVVTQTETDVGKLPWRKEISWLSAKVIQYEILLESQ